MKKFLAPIFSQGMLVFAIVFFLLDLLAVVYFQGWKSLYLVIVLEIAGIFTYAISRLGDADKSLFKVADEIPDQL